jgi:hypothetical protein
MITDRNTTMPMTGKVVGNPARQLSANPPTPFASPRHTAAPTAPRQILAPRLTSPISREDG